MAFVEVYEFAGTRGRELVRAAPPIAKQILTIASTSGGDLSAGFNRSTVMITVVSTAACRVAIGTSPTSTSAHMLIPSAQLTDFAVIAGQKILALSSTST